MNYQSFPLILLLCNLEWLFKPAVDSHTLSQNWNKLPVGCRWMIFIKKSSIMCCHETSFDRQIWVWINTSYNGCYEHVKLHEPRLSLAPEVLIPWCIIRFFALQMLYCRCRLLYSKLNDLLSSAPYLYQYWVSWTLFLVTS